VAAVAAVAVPRIAILNGGKKAFRMIENVDALVKRLKREIPGDTEIPVVDFERKSLEFQVQLFSNVDILISGHGAQLAGLPFMPHRGAVLEIFPLGYYAPHYFASQTATLSAN
jgi:capsular polysaccharide biosynthesis protein